MGHPLTPTGLVARTEAWSEGARWPEGIEIDVTLAGDTMTVAARRPMTPDVQRTFTQLPPVCRDVELVAAVAVAMAIEALAVAHPMPPVDAPPPSPPAIALQPTPRVEPSEETPAPTPRSPTFELALGAGGGWGLSPWSIGELTVGARARWRRIAIAADIAVGGRVVDAFAGSRGKLGLLRVGPTVAVCSPWRRGRWRAAICAVGSAGALWARAVATRAPSTDVVPWLATGARTQLALEISPRWSLEARSDVLAGIVRPTIAARRGDEILRWRTPALGWRGGLFASVQLGGDVKRRGAPRMKERG